MGTSSHILEFLSFCFAPLKVFLIVRQLIRRSLERPVPKLVRPLSVVIPAVFPKSDDVGAVLPDAVLAPRINIRLSCPAFVSIKVCKYFYAPAPGTHFAWRFFNAFRGRYDPRCLPFGRLLPREYQRVIFCSDFAHRLSSFYYNATGYMASTPSFVTTQVVWLAPPVSLLVAV